MEQFESAMKMDFAVKGALMADVHLGYSLPIGGIVATKDVIVPAWVGFDIGCGMAAMKLPVKREQIFDAVRNIDYKQCIAQSIYRSVPTGFNINRLKCDSNFSQFESTDKLKEIFSKDDKGLKSCGSLGGGNHFIEIAYDENDDVWVVVHSGSRGIGHAVATHYMKLASGTDKAKEGHFGLSVDSIEGKAYITDLEFCLEFALQNRIEMIRKVNREIRHYTNHKKDWCILINRNHNHAELKDGLWIHRKGATHAEDGMKGIIPGNMRDGSFIVVGKGNSDSLFSSSHGAGRVLGRKQEKRELTMDEFKEEMEGIEAKVEEDTLDESPMAYKNIYDVMKQQKDLVEVVAHLKPIINIKG